MLKFVVILFFLLPVSNSQAAVEYTHQEKVAREILQRASSLFKPQKRFVAKNELEILEIEIGQKLFSDLRISGTGTFACTSCHQEINAGADSLPFSSTARGGKTQRNTQSSLNLYYQSMFTWRGESQSLRDEVRRSLLSREKNDLGDLEVFEKKLEAAGYAEDFQKLSSSDLKAELSTKAINGITKYLESLVGQSSFDRFLEGDIYAISESARAGVSEFMTLGCSGCHYGPAVGGAELQRFGVYDDYWNVTGSKNKDSGKYAVSKNKADLYVFKVPSLRNVTQTAPYFHDGSAKDLETAIRWMAQLQLIQNLSDEQLKNLKSFLESLQDQPSRKDLGVPKVGP